jgi:hypothetical protein
MKNQHLIGELLRNNKSCVGRGAIINFKTHNRQRKQSEEREEMEQKMNKMNIKGSGHDLKKLTPLRFNY